MMNNQVLHILPDEKVTANFIKLMNEASFGLSFYIIIGKSAFPKNAKLIDEQNVIYININDQWEVSKVKSLINNYRIVCFHSDEGLPIFDKYHRNKYYYVIWGADLYETLLAPCGYQLYENEYIQYKVRAGHMPVFLYKFLVKIRDLTRKQILLKKMHLIDGIISIKCDYDLLSLYFPSLKIPFIGTFCYYPIEDLVGAKNLNQYCFGKDVWVNNSPAMNGNHVSVFCKLKQFSNDIKVHSPLAYGDARFINYLKQKGYEILGNKFIPLTTFVDPDVYYEKFLSANAFIFGHYRQCGFGNVLMALYFGGKCFFYKENPLLNYLRELDFTVFEIESDLSESFATTSLDTNLREKNRRLVNELSSHNAILKQLRTLFSC